MHPNIYASALLLTLSASCAHPLARAPSAQPAVESPSAATHKIGEFAAHTVQDGYGRTIHYYLSRESDARLPLFLFIAGSGCESNMRKDAAGKVVGGYEKLLLESARGKAHVMVVEKPGVNLFDSTDAPGSAEKCSDAFRAEHTLERWTEALNAALKAALTLPSVDRGKVVVIGHSEGAVMAARIAAINPSVTHVVALSGSGASQLFDFDFVVDKSGKAQDEVYKKFDEINRNYGDIHTLYWGHPARRWSTFMACSSSEDLSQTRARILLVHGARDKSVPVQSFDFLVADLKRKHRTFDFQRIDGADHALNSSGDKKGTGFKRAFDRIVEWSR